MCHREIAAGYAGRLHPHYPDVVVLTATQACEGSRLRGLPLEDDALTTMRAPRGEGDELRE